MATTHRRSSNNDRLHIMNHAHDSIERGVLDWISNSDFNEDENHIFFDFETVPTGARERGNPDKFELSSLGAEPFELGLSVRTSTGERFHRSFLFTPPRINTDSRNPYKAGFKPGLPFHKEAINFHLTDAHGNIVVSEKTSEDAPDGRFERLEKVLKPYTTGEGTDVKVPWGKIEKFLFTECGVDPEKMTNFMAHNGGFDFPILERLFTTDLGKYTGFSRLYRDINDTGKFRWSNNPNTPWYGGWHNDRDRIDSTGSKGRRRGNKSHPEKGGGHRQDTMLEMMRLFGNANEKGENNERFVLRKKHYTGKRLGTNGKQKRDYQKSWNPVGYAPGLEYAGGGGFSTGTSLDDFRASIEYCAFQEEEKDGKGEIITPAANNPVKDLFEDLKTSAEAWEEAKAKIQASALSDKEKKAAIANLPVHHLLKTEGDGEVGLTEAFAKELNRLKYKTKTAKDYYMAFNAVSAHEGAGDTAFTTEVMFPFLESMIKFFDHSQYHPFDEEGNFIKRQGDAFIDAFQQVQDNWGGMLGAYPKKNDRSNDGYDCLPLSKYATAKGTGHAFLDGVRDKLNTADKNRSEWFDEAGTKREISPLLAPISVSTPVAGVQSQMKGAGTPSTPPTEHTSHPVVAAMVREDKMPNVKDFPEHLQRFITGPITIRKWEGSDDRGPRLVVSVPIGNSRVTFSESYWDDARAVDTSVPSYKPFLGVAAIGSDKDVKPSIVRDYLKQLLLDFQDEKAPFGSLGRAIQKVLSAKHDIMTDEMSGDGDIALLDHRELNDFVNTPASAWLSQSLGDKPITNEDIRALGMPVQDNDPNGAKTYNAYTYQVFSMLNQLDEGGDLLAGAKKQMLFGAPHLVGQLEQFSEQFNPEEMFNQFLGANQLDPTLYTLVDGDPDAPVFTPTAEGGQEVNMARLLTTFFSGNEATDQEGNLIEGLHPQQFLHPDAIGQGGLLSAFYNYLDFSHKVGPEGQDVGRVLFDNYQMSLRDPHETHNQTSQGVLLEQVLDPETSEDDKVEAANILAGSTPPAKLHPEVQEQADRDVQQTKANKVQFDKVRNASSSSEDFKANLNALLESLGINDASPFVTDNYIDSIRGQDSVDAAYNALFIPREPEKTLDGVQNLINEAVERYGGASDTRNATNLVRELEWIRTNHPSVFTQESMNTALNTNDSDSIQGQYLDIMNTAYKAMGDLAGEKLSLIQEEQVHMGDRFMSSSHKQFLDYSYNEEHKDNWYDVDDPTTVQEHFAPEPESEQESRSFREIARDMAVATAKAPLEALKYYTNWNALSEQYKDASSGRSEAGQKLLDAVRGGEKFREVNIGTPEEPDYARTEEEYNYYIANIPVGGEAQPSILRQFLQGKKTYGDLEDEQEESQAGKRTRIRNVMDEQRKWEQQQIAERSTFATTPITPEQQQQGVESHDYFAGQREAYAEDVKGAVQQVREGEGSDTPPGYKQEGGLFVPKSLDKLREYLLRV